MAKLEATLRSNERRIQRINERFMGKVDRTGECWLWTGHKNPQGYGLFWDLKNRMRRAHRASWELFKGPIPAGSGYHGTCVLHKCDTPSCVNPEHLFLGSNKDNVLDKWAKGRGRSVGRPAPLVMSIFCHQGHRRTRETVYINARGYANCRTCSAERMALKRLALKATACGC